GIVVKTMPIAISNVAILNPKTKKADRVGIKVVAEEGKKVRRVRIYKSDGQTIEA
ncbi:MAG: 50S ribosomal protein L24, partial [Neisseriaceae bacterium]|nr:50S ribosomal protein L24 [Neisseriaceae bacterium]